MWKRPRAGGRYEAVLPRPTRDVSGVVYYLEAVDRAFSSFRTEEFRPRVVLDESDCEEDETRPAYVEGPAAITVGATVPGSSLSAGIFQRRDRRRHRRRRESRGKQHRGRSSVSAPRPARRQESECWSAESDSNSTSVPVGGGRDHDHSPYHVRRIDHFGSCEQPIRSSPVSRPPPILRRFPSVTPYASTPAAVSRGRQIASYLWEFNDGRDGREGRVVTRQYTTRRGFPGGARRDRRERRGGAGREGGSSQRSLGRPRRARARPGSDHDRAR